MSRCWDVLASLLRSCLVISKSMLQTSPAFIKIHKHCWFTSERLCEVGVEITGQMLCLLFVFNVTFVLLLLIRLIKQSVWCKHNKQKTTTKYQRYSPVMKCKSRSEHYTAAQDVRCCFTRRTGNNYQITLGSSCVLSCFLFFFLH